MELITLRLMLRRRMLYRTVIEYSGASVLDILCSDLTYVSAANYASSGKTAIGVIVGNSDRKLRAISLVSATGKPWASGAVGNITTLPDISSSTAAEADMDGKNNTALAFNFSSLNQDDSTAIGWCSLFSTQGTTAGQWYLPSVGELCLIPYPTVNLNNSLTVCGGETIDLSTDYFVSSCENNATYCWFRGGLLWNRVRTSNSPKIETTTFKVRPFILIEY